MISFVSKKRKTLGAMARRRMSVENSRDTVLALFYYPAEKQKRQWLLRAAAALVFVFLLLYACIRRVIEYRRTPRYHSLEEQDYRRFRFPSIEQRVKLYMSNWYVPPCDAVTDAIAYESMQNIKWHNTIMNAFKVHDVTTQQQHHQNASRAFLIDNNVSIGHVFYATEQALLECYLRPWSIRYYCSDCKESMFRALTGANIDLPPPLFLQFSDETLSLVNGMDGQVHENPRIPIFKKIRHAIRSDELSRITASACYSKDTPRAVPKTVRQQEPDELQPIIWKMNVARHYGYLKLVKRFDRPWSEKWNVAVFRGNLTGFEDSILFNNKKNATTMTDHPHHQEICFHLLRCRLVLQNAHSKIIDARLTSTAGRLPEILNGVNLTGNVLWKEEMLSYKGIIILEGNDVSSGLKWAMLSQSVVLMPPPTFTSWAMEELLEPWIHYIPLDSNLTDVEMKVQWMLDHEAEAQRISHRAFLWIMDLVYHPDAVKDELLINEEIMKRYRALFASPVQAS